MLDFCCVSVAPLNSPICHTENCSGGKGLIEVVPNKKNSRILPFYDTAMHTFNFFCAFCLWDIKHTQVVLAYQTKRFVFESFSVHFSLIDFKIILGLGATYWNSFKHVWALSLGCSLSTLIFLRLVEVPKPGLMGEKKVSSTCCLVFFDWAPKFGQKPHMFRLRKDMI